MLNAFAFPPSKLRHATKAVGVVGVPANGMSSNPCLAMTPGYSADDVQQKIEKGYTTAARILDANGNDGA